jgi:RNA polymerase sigma factor (sigma-70 family)
VQTPRPEPAAEARRIAAVALLAARRAVFQRTARRFSLCADDADDSFQRAVEILLTKAPPLEPPALAAWMQVVTRREALAVRRTRERGLGAAVAAGDGVVVVDQLACESPGPHERLERRERLARAARLLRRLKPQERRALVLQAEGFSYAEICEITGWTYTKTNRCLAEGRARLRQLGALESGSP